MVMENPEMNIKEQLLEIVKGRINKDE